MSSTIARRLLDVIDTEVFGLPPGGYRRSNAFWTAHAIAELVEAEAEPLRAELQQQQKRIRERYRSLSQRYQESKNDNAIPLS